MILQYQQFENDKLNDYKKKGLDIKIFKPKDFSDYKKEVENNGGKVTVIRNTKLKKYKKKDNNQNNDEYIEIQGKKFELKKEKALAAKGYIPVGEDRFVRIESWLILWIFLFGLALTGLLIGLSIKPSPNPDIEEPTNNPIEMEDENKWDGQQHNNGNNSTTGQENTVIPGFANITARKGASLIKLYNLPENTVNFIYTITESIATVEVETFKTIDETQKFITEHTIVYSNYYDEETGNYQLKDKDGNITDYLVEYKAVQNPDGTYTVNEITSEVIYFTKGIAPDNYVDWDICESFEKGVHDVQFRISTYDVNSNSACYGAIQDVTITVVD